MGRNPRIQFAGALYHVTTRGNAKERVCLDDWDFVWLVAQIGEAVTRYNWVCQSYCVLGNHFHVSVATPEPNLAKGMRILNGAYAQRFNRRYGRVGHVFQGPYGAELIRRHEHLLEVGRYIALNPVRAGLCSRPELWPWSSYPATIGLDEPPPWLAVDALLAPFGGGRHRLRFAIARLSKTDSARYAQGLDQPGPGTWSQDMAVETVRGHVRGPGPPDQRRAPDRDRPLP